MDTKSRRVSHRRKVKCGDKASGAKPTREKWKADVWCTRDVGCLILEEGSGAAKTALAPRSELEEREEAWDKNSEDS